VAALPGMPPGINGQESTMIPLLTWTARDDRLFEARGTDAQVWRNHREAWEFSAHDGRRGCYGGDYTTAREAMRACERALAREMA
jgi:hypothetical protein